MRLLDAFCGAGGAGMGYYRAGFEVVGVDIEPQPNYPFKFIKADALEYIEQNSEAFDVIHTSPPCQRFSTLKGLAKLENHPDLVEQTREMLKRTGKPYVIENVPGAPLINPLTLCGSMFGLPLIRHRLFECEPVIWFPPAACSCKGLFTNSDHGHSSFENGASAICVIGHMYSRKDGMRAMEIDWITNRKELAQAIPPAYTEYIGKELMRLLEPEHV